MNVGFGFSQLEDHIQAVNEAVGRALIGLGNIKADLALIFTSTEFAHILVLKTANNLLRGVPVLGCSSSGIITNQGMFKHGFAILLINLGKQTFFNISGVQNINKKNSTLAGKDLGSKLLAGFKDIRRSLSIIFSDTLAAEGDNLINGLQENLGKSFPLIGASTSDNLTSQKTFQYLNQEIICQSCCGIIFGGKFNFGLSIKHGWEALGKIHCITKANDNIIKEIDGAPAVKLYEDYFAKSSLELTRELQRISVSYPLGIYLEGEKEYLLRNIMSIKEDGALITQGDVPLNSRIKLMISTQESRLKATAASCQEAKRNLGNAKIKFVLIFDSAARFSLLGRQQEKELEEIKKIFDQTTPLIGICTNGEQAPLQSVNYLGRNYFHNQSINILAIGDQ